MCRNDPFPKSQSCGRSLNHSHGRRRFVAGALGASAGLLFAPLLSTRASAETAATEVKKKMTLSPLVELNDGKLMPQLGLGVWRASNEEARMAVREAFACGYRSVDTASIYRNEEGVGQGFRDSGLDRTQVFITTKVWNDDQGFEQAQRALEQSLQRLKLEYVDLLLIHWPAPQRDRYLDTWRALIKLRERGLTRSIGVSNFAAAHLERITSETDIKPVLNQIELHPYLQQRELRAVHERLGIRTEAWSPLAQGKVVDDAVIGKIAEKHGRTPVQITIRWHLDNGIIVIPKSVTPSRIRSNFDVFDFKLDDEDMRAIAALDAQNRLGPDPERLG